MLHSLSGRAIERVGLPNNIVIKSVGSFNIMNAIQYGGLCLSNSLILLNCLMVCRSLYIV